MRRIYLITMTLMVCLMVGCGGKKVSAESFVKDFYTNIFEEEQLNVAGEGPADVLSPDLITTINKCSEKGEQMGEIAPHCDYILWLNAQDYDSNTTLTNVEVMKEEADSAVVKATINNFGNTTDVTMVLKWIEESWRIDDYLTAEGRSVKADMKKYLE